MKKSKKECLKFLQFIISNKDLREQLDAASSISLDTAEYYYGRWKESIGDNKDAGILPNSPESVKRMIFGGSDDMININAKWEGSHPDNVKEAPFVPVFYSQEGINKIKKARKDLDDNK